MQSTFMRVCAASFRVKSGDVACNAQLALKRIKEASEKGVQLLLLPELCLTGSCCASLFEHQALLSEATNALHSLVKLTSDLSILCFIGLPVRLGGEVASCMAAVQKGRLLALFPKQPVLEEQLLGVPTGNIAMRCNETVTALGFGAQQAEGGGLHLRASSLAASNNSLQKLDEIFGATSGAIVYASNAGDSVTDYVFDGNCAIYENGELLARADGYEGAMAIADIDTGVIGGSRPGPFLQITLPPLKGAKRRLAKAPWGDSDAQCARTLELQARALAHRAQHIGAKGFVVGVSGGLDSALALLASAKAADLLGMERRQVLGVMLPGYGSTSRTGKNAKKLIEALGAEGQTISILPLSRQLFADIGHDEAKHDTTFENTQARQRTVLLMNIANQRNMLQVGTGDLSESALGFTTFGGDHLSFYNPNGSLLKSQIQSVLSYAARKDKSLSVLKEILFTPISPELLPPVNDEIQQRTEDIVGPYDLMDFYIYYLLRYAMPCGMLYERARLAFPRYGKELLKSRLEILIKRFFSNQFKRNCMPEGPLLGELTLSSRSFRMPSDASAAAWLQELSELK